MRHHPAHALPASALALAIGVAVAGCGSAAATAGAASAASSATAASSPTALSSPAAAPSATAPSSPTAAARASAPVYGPPGPDPACAAALKAEQTLRARQGKDQDSQSALDQDFMNFAGALSAAAGKETRPATAKAMTALASDYTALVESQSGAAQLPAMSTVQDDGAAFDTACS